VRENRERELSLSTDYPGDLGMCMRETRGRAQSVDWVCRLTDDQSGLRLCAREKRESSSN
jgi:hypothetical protein